MNPDQVEYVLSEIINVKPTTFLWTVFEKAGLSLEVLQDIGEKEASVKTEEELIDHIKDSVTAIEDLVNAGDLTKRQHAFFFSWVAFVDYTLHRLIQKGIYPNTTNGYRVVPDWRVIADKLPDHYVNVINEIDHDCEAVRDGWNPKYPENNRRLMQLYAERLCVYMLCSCQEDEDFRIVTTLLDDVAVVICMI